jgi:RNA polymerase sigma factor (sigma-70 family)
MVGRTFQGTLAAAQAGADWALAAVYREWHPPLLRFLTAQEPDDGEDLASEVWLDVGHALAGFEGDERAFRRWLFTIAHRRLIDFRRTRTRRRTTPIPSERFAERPDPREAFVGVEGGDVLACLAGLTSEQAEIVLLRVVADLHSDEVAAIMGKKPGTVRVIQKRALDRLAQLLEGAEQEAVT